MTSTEIAALASPLPLILPVVSPVEPSLSKDERKSTPFVLSLSKYERDHTHPTRTVA